MKTVELIRSLALEAQSEGIPLESARLCSVCWTVHNSDSCPACNARQWVFLAPLMEGFNEIDFGKEDGVYRYVM